MQAAHFLMDKLFPDEEEELFCSSYEVDLLYVFTAWAVQLLALSFSSK